MSQLYRVMTVCWGNICRSPMAEYMLRAAFEDARLGDVVEVVSSGTSSEETGNSMDRRAIAALRRNGVADLGWRTHRARRFNARDFEDVDLILATDYIHDDILRGRARGNPEYVDKIRMLRSFDPKAVAADDLGMADPWYGRDKDFDITFRQVEQAIPGIVAYVKEQLRR